MKTYHLVYEDKHWILEAEKPNEEGIDFEYKVTKKWAVSVSVAYCRDKFKETGKPVSLRIHKRNGQIQEERSYGRDPSKSKG